MRSNIPLPAPAVAPSSRVPDRAAPHVFRHRALSSHPLSSSDLILSVVTDRALSACIAPRTRACYDSAVKGYLTFVSDRDLCPFPVDALTLASWCVYTCTTVAVRSLKVYLSSVRSAHIDAGFNWTLEGSPIVARAVRFLKRRYGMKDKALKVPISLSTLLSMCKRLPGWPIPRDMCHDDRLFIAASAMAIVCFLRGGEFLCSSGSGRPLLRQRDVIRVRDGPGAPITVNVVQPKSRWWLLDTVVPCFDLGRNAVLNPSFWIDAYRVHSSVKLSDNGPAFVLSDGSPLSKSWMLSKSSYLLSVAGVRLTDSLGSPVSVKASSWRAGGVQSAKTANLPEPLIKALGRWSSDAWSNYHYATLTDLRKAVGNMWTSSGASLPSLVVGSFCPSGLFEDTP